jgi:hypothetical protein
LLTGLRQGHSAKLSRSPKRQPLSYSGYLWLIRVPSEGQSARTHLADQADRRFKPCHNPVTPPQADLRAVSVCFHTNTITLYSTNNRLSIIFKKNLSAYFINSAKMLVFSTACPPFVAQRRPQNVVIWGPKNRIAAKIPECHYRGSLRGLNAGRGNLKII